MSMYSIDIREAVTVPYGTVTVSGLDRALDVAEERLLDLREQIVVARHAIHAVRESRRRASMGRILDSPSGFIRRKRDTVKPVLALRAAAKVSADYDLCREDYDLCQEDYE